MPKLQDYFEWVQGLSDEEAVLAILGLGMVFTRRDKTRWWSNSPSANILDECREYARKGTLTVNLSRTWQRIELFYPFLFEARQLADFARQVIDKSTTWLVIEDLNSILVDSKSIQLRGTSKLPRPKVDRLMLYDAMFSTMQQQVSDLVNVKFWSSEFPSYSAVSELTFEWPLRVRSSRPC